MCVTRGSREDFLILPFRLSFCSPLIGVSRRSSSHMSCIFVNSLGSTFLDPRVRVFSVRSSHRLGLCPRSRGLIGIGSGVGWVFWHGWQKEGWSMFCTGPGGVCRSTNVGEGEKSSRKLLRAGPRFQLEVRAGSLLPFWVWRRYLRQGDCERVFADVAGLALDEL